MAVRKLTLLVLFLIFAAVLILFSAVLLLWNTIPVKEAARWPTDNPPAYYIVMIGRRIDTPFWQRVYAEARTAAEEHNMIIEFIGPSSDADRNQIDEYMNYAVAARADGILSYINDSSSIREVLEFAGKKGIPVVVLENDTVTGSRQSFVGISSYELGKNLGTLILEAGGENSTVLVLPDTSSSRTSGMIMMSGIQETLREYPKIEISVDGSEQAGSSAYEQFIRNRIMTDDDLDIIVTLNVNDTMRAAQAVIELNKMDDISIIAFRENENILEYVRRGIIYAVVVPDAEQIGRRAVEVMHEFLEKKYTNDYVITDMYIIYQDTDSGLY
ncbi:substrate-binding domain-containing protein [Brucepastera parasyntrophica]|uniref:sugar ABC transporter substrate-binding protein n=1 Tax=Brucepastera parasyntrophica TaxID=2880008 RepID=UPI00210C3D84|nr:substrate-binding domain-containing protein [Brucepastera parasyntrophica]ULQ60862.1 substrate-binding domain-containing protein [Brucepastera parasyntrophica]